MNYVQKVFVNEEYVEKDSARKVDVNNKVTGEKKVKEFESWNRWSSHFEDLKRQHSERTNN